MDAINVLQTFPWHVWLSFYLHHCVLDSVRRQVTRPQGCVGAYVQISVPSQPAMAIKATSVNRHLQRLSSCRVCVFQKKITCVATYQLVCH
jgi:hypothetical protein